MEIAEIKKRVLKQESILYIEDDAAMRKMFSLLQNTLLKDYQFSYAETLA